MIKKLQDTYRRIRRRIKLRDRQHELGHGNKARREARAVRKLRARAHRIHRWVTAPRVMFDAVTVPNIPGTEGVAVAGYTGGLFHTIPILRRLFKGKRVIVSIAVRSSEDADFLDIETGDATNVDAARWFRRKATNRGFYTFASNAQALIDTLAAAGIERHEYVLWIAHWDGKHICSPQTCGFPRSDGTQWTTHGETYDESFLHPSFWRFIL